MAAANRIRKETEKKKRDTDTTADPDDSKARVKQKTILLVEDDESHAELIRRLFENNSSAWVIHHVDSIRGALKWLEGNKMPFLVIADYLMPDGTGLDLIKGAMSAEEADFPLIIVTRAGSEQLAAHALKSGALDYVVKNPEELRELPWRADRAIREWKNLIKRKRVEEELGVYVRELERATQDLEDFVLLLETHADNFEDIGGEYLRGVRIATERTKAITEDLLMLSSIGRRFIESEKVDLNELLEEIINDLSALIDGRGGDVITGKLPTILTQRFWMKDLLINLIDSGLTLTRSWSGKPRVDIRCEEREKDHIFKVTANGIIDISEKELSDIFTSSGGLHPYDCGGRFLKLALCKKVVDKFGGNIRAESRPEEGTTFSFTLPKK